VIPATGYHQTDITGTNPEARFVEPWSERKARRAAEVRREAQQARDLREQRYQDRVRRQQMDAQLQRAANIALSQKHAATAEAVVSAEREAQVDALIVAAARVRTVPTWKKILRETADAYGLSVEEICGYRRIVPYVRARQQAMWRMKTELGMSMPEIGRRIGNKDHTTVLHGIRAHQARLDRATSETSS
jgi:chromosomal replication initiation ATPase DnaA